MRTRHVDILVVGVDKVTSKTTYVYDALNERGVSTLIFTDDRLGEMRGPQNTQSGTHIVPTPGRPVRNVFRFILILLRTRPKHVEIYQTKPFQQLAFALITRLSGRPLSVFCIGELYTWDRHHPVRRFIDRFTFKLASLAILTELYMEETVRRHNLISSQRTVFAHNRIPAQGEEPAVERPPVVLWVNTLKPWRRAGLLLDAAKKVIQERPDIQFRIVGATRHLPYMQSTHEHEQEIANRIEAEGLEESVELVPFTQNVQEHYREASLFVLPGDLVYCNYSLLEAMERGVVPLVADAEGADRIVVDGVSGRVLPQDPSVWAEAILELLEDPTQRKEMGRAARARVRDHFDAAAFPDILLPAYQGAMTTWRNRCAKSRDKFANTHPEVQREQ